MGQNQGKGGGGRTPAMSRSEMRAKGLGVIPRNIQRKFQGGLTYNLKIVLRGARGTGKSVLLSRLQGGPFIPEHFPTPQLRTAHINWNYKASDDIIKVEVWDVVDKGVAAASQGGGPPPGVADATTVDVYKGAHAVIFCCNPCQHSSFEYVKAQIGRVPLTLDVLLLSLFRDRKEEHVVQESDFQDFIRRQERRIRFTECSVFDGFGLRQIYTFLNLPFLKLKLRSLKETLRLFQEDLNTAEEEMEVVLEQDYDAYLAAARAHKKLPAPIEQKKFENTVVDEKPKEGLIHVAHARAVSNGGEDLVTFNPGQLDESFFGSDEELELPNEDAEVDERTNEVPRAEEHTRHSPSPKGKGLLAESDSEASVASDVFEVESFVPAVPLPALAPKRERIAALKEAKPAPPPEKAQVSAAEVFDELMAQKSQPANAAQLDSESVVVVEPEEVADVPKTVSPPLVEAAVEESSEGADRVESGLPSEKKSSSGGKGGKTPVEAVPKKKRHHKKRHSKEASKEDGREKRRKRRHKHRRHKRDRKKEEDEPMQEVESFPEGVGDGEFF